MMIHSRDIQVDAASGLIIIIVRKGKSEEDRQTAN